MICPAGRLESINMSRGGLPKTSVFEALVTPEGLDGDRQGDRRFHGGPDRAVILFSLDVIQQLQREGHPIAAGTTGENLTLAGIDWASVVPGTILRIGDVRLLVTTFVTPCTKVSDAFMDQNCARISQKVHPGWSRVGARVLAGGIVRVGDPIAMEPDA